MELSKAKELERYRLKKLLALLKDYPEATQRELADRLGVSLTTLRSDLDLLKFIKEAEGGTGNENERSS